MIKDKSFKILFVIYIIAFLMDLGTTLRMGELLKYLEANPLFKFGGLPLITLINFLVMWFWYYLYKKGSITTRFIVVFSLVAVITTRVIAISNNIIIAQNPPTLQQAQAVTQVMKTEAMRRLYIVNILPFFNGMMAWIFFRYDHHIMRKEDVKTEKS